MNRPRLFLILAPILVASQISVAQDSKMERAKSCLISWVEGITTPIETKYKSVKEPLQLLKGSALKKISPEALTIFDHIQQDADYSLTPIEKSQIENEGLSAQLERYRGSNKFVQQLNWRLGLLYRAQAKGLKFRPSNWDWVRSRPIIAKTADVTTFLLRRLKFLIPPLPGPNAAIANRIYAKALIDPSYLPNKWENSFLKNWDLEADFNRYKTDLKAYSKTFSKLSKVNQVGNYLKWSVALSAVGLGVVGNQYIHSSENNNEDSPNGMSKYDEKVELIFLSPMPHASVRIGGVIYNYGVFRVDRLTLDEFKKVVGFGEGISGNETRVELKLTGEEREKLQNYLEQDVGKIYPLIFPYNDCVSQSNKAIKNAARISVPPVLNRSQAGSIAYYKLLKLLGSDKVGSIKFSSVDGHSPAQEKLKDAAANVIDSLFFIRNAGKMLLVTPFLDSHHLTFEAPQTPTESK